MNPNCFDGDRRHAVCRAGRANSRIPVGLGGYSVIGYTIKFINLPSDLADDLASSFGTGIWHGQAIWHNITLFLGHCLCIKPLKYMAVFARYE